MPSIADLIGAETSLSFNKAKDAFSYSGTILPVNHGSTRHLQQSLYHQNIVWLNLQTVHLP